MEHQNFTKYFRTKKLPLVYTILTIVGYKSFFKLNLSLK